MQRVLYLRKLSNSRGGFIQTLKSVSEASSALGVLSDPVGAGLFWARLRGFGLEGLV